MRGAGSQHRRWEGTVRGWSPVRLRPKSPARRCATAAATTARGREKVGLRQQSVEGDNELSDEARERKDMRNDHITLQQIKSTKITILQRRWEAIPTIVVCFIQCCTVPRGLFSLSLCVLSFYWSLRPLTEFPKSFAKNFRFLITSNLAVHA